MLKQADAQPAVDAKWIAKLEAEVGNLIEAMAAGALKRSPALAGRLAKAEAELDALRAAQKAPRTKVEKLIPRLVDDLETALVNDAASNDVRSIARARAQIRKFLGGTIRVVPTRKEIRFQTEAGATELALKRAAGGEQISLVAGARFPGYMSSAFASCSRHEHPVSQW